MIKKLLFLVFSLSLSVSSLAQAQNENNILESLSSHDIKTLTETAQQITNNLSDEEKTLIEKATQELMSPEKAHTALKEVDFMTLEDLTPIRIGTIIIFGLYVIVLHKIFLKKRRVIT